MGYRWGFKTEAEDLARDTRTELGLRPLDPLDPWKLLDWLEIPLIPLSDYGEDAPGAVAHLGDTEIEAFSAVTVFEGVKRTIVHNDLHDPGRQASNLAHEASHGLLHHAPTPALDNRGCRNWNQDIEDEAQWLGAALLVTTEAALAIVRRGTPVDEAAAQYGVSRPLIQWRINATGAKKRVERARRVRQW